MSNLNKRNPIAKAIKLALLATATVSALSATAVFAEEEAEDEEGDTKITITGSRIKRTDIETASPVYVTSAEDIKLSGFTRIEDMMNSLPQIEASNTAFDANGATGTASVDLRGLGAVRTLVLVNGRRLQPGNLNSSSPDINQIPAALVERVEVLTGGGSSTYGSDAVAGVVNFIMKDDFEGIEVVFGASGYQHDNDNEFIQGLMEARGFEFPTGSSGVDGRANNIDVTMGGTFDGGKGHATAYVTWREVNELRQASRDYSSCALNNAGTVCGGSLNTIVPSFFIGDIDPVTGGQDNYDLWTLDPNSDGFLIPHDGTRYNYAPVNHFLRPDTRWTMGAFVNYEINEHARPYLEFMTMRDRTVAQIAESGTFFAAQYDLSIDNPLLSATQRQQIIDNFGIGPGEDFSVYIGKRNVEGGPRASNIETNSNRVVFGVEGDINDIWSYDTSFQHNTTSSSVAYINDFFAPRIATAIDANGQSCADTAGCVPYDVFTFNGVTSEQAATLTGVGVRRGEIKETIAGGFVSGEFEGLSSAEDPIGVVFGAEYRRSSFVNISDEVFEQGLLLGQGGATPSLGGKYTIKDVFSEVSIPLIQGAEGVESLILDLGVRYSDYERVDSEATYKVGLDYMPIDGYKIRASYNRAVRSPNVSELFATQSNGLWNGTDPCAGIIADGETPAQSAAQCANSGVTAAQYGNISLSPASQYNGIFGGNPDLSPEIADTITFGVVANPMDNLNFSIDYFDIQIEDVIGSINAELMVTQCGLTGNASFCGNVTRGSSGSLWRGTSGFVTATNVNLGERHWTGIDVNANYSLEFSAGVLQFNLVGTLMDTKETEPLPGDAGSVFDCVDKVSVQCFATPEWRHSLRASWQPADADWTVSAKWRYFGDVGYELGVDGPDTLADGGLGQQSYLDLNFAMDINENVGFLVGVNNLFDQEPPLVGGTLGSNANTVAGFYDALGRFLHASVTFTF